MNTLQIRILRVLERSLTMGAVAAFSSCATPPEPVTPDRTLTTSKELAAEGDDALCLPENAKALRIPNQTWLEDICRHINEKKLYAFCISPDDEGECVPPDKVASKVEELLPDGFTCEQRHSFRINAKVGPVCGPVEWEGDGTCCYISNLTPNSIKHVPRIMLGRPFVVDGQSRAAEPHASEGWSSPISLDTQIPEGLRREIALRWAHDGCDEHASIASFARFLMRLLSRGAPRALVAATAEAIEDEARHAHACFSIASAYAGEPLAPDVLETQDAMEAADDAALLRDVITQGCVGETMAAAEAGWKLGVACEPAARDALTAITEEETRHAELAWAFVAWMLERRPELTSVAQQAFLAARPRALRGALEVHGSTPRELVLMAHGVLPKRVSDALLERAWADIVSPAMQTLFSPTSHAARRA